MPRKFTLEQSRAGGRAQGPISKTKGLGIFSIKPGSPEHIENCRKGGITQGNIQGKKNVESGELDRIRNLPQTKAAQSRVGKITGKIYGQIYGPLNDMSKIKTPESLRLGQIRGGLLSRHTRHHVNRKLFNPACPLCAASKERGESWWTAEYISTDKRSWN